jgi:hypothetical protein
MGLLWEICLNANRIRESSFEVREMTAEPYPFFIRPPEFGVGRENDFTRDQARKHFEWFKAHFRERVPVLLNYLDEKLTGDCAADLRRIAARIAQLLPLDQFSYMQEVGDLLEFTQNRKLHLPPRRRPNAQGVSMAYDMACLLAVMLLDLDPRIKWHLPTRAPTYIDHHCPTMRFPHSKIPFNMVRVSIAHCASMFDSKWGTDIYAVIYEDVQKGIAELPTAG